MGSLGVTGTQAAGTDEAAEALTCDDATMPWRARTGDLVGGNGKSVNIGAFCSGSAPAPGVLSPAAAAMLVNCVLGYEQHNLRHSGLASSTAQLNNGKQRSQYTDAKRTLGSCSETQLCGRNRHVFSWVLSRAFAVCCGECGHIRVLRTAGRLIGCPLKHSRAGGDAEQSA